MSSKKINWRLADTIADRIANKAFEHLIDPLNKQIQAVADAVVAKDMTDWVWLEKRQIVGKVNGGSADIEIVPGSYEIPEGHEHCVSATFGYTGRRWDSIRFFDDAAYEQLTPLVKQRNELRSKREALSTELRKQLDGKTVSAAMKAWPEATSIIAEVCDINNVSMTQPLEALLARFLPMLPAPTTNSEGV